MARLVLSKGKANAPAKNGPGAVSVGDEFMIRVCARLRQDESGVTSMEYAFIAMLVAMAILTALGTIGTQLVVPFTKMGTTLTTANGG